MNSPSYTGSVNNVCPICKAPTVLTLCIVCTVLTECTVPPVCTLQCVQFVHHDLCQGTQPTLQGGVERTGLWWQTRHKVPLTQTLPSPNLTLTLLNITLPSHTITLISPIFFLLTPPSLSPHLSLLSHPRPTLCPQPHFPLTHTHSLL